MFLLGGEFGLETGGKVRKALFGCFLSFSLGFRQKSKMYKAFGLVVFVGQEVEVWVLARF